MPEGAASVSDMPLDAWCASIPGLTSSGVGMWGLAGDHAVSFPDEAHANLAMIEERSYWFAHRNQVIASVVGRYTPHGRIFDIGGGNGIVSVALREAGLESVVIEPGETGAAIARQRGLPVIRAPFQALELEDSTLPAAGMFDVLEHIEDADGALRGLHRVLMPGGMVYIAVPTYNFLWSVQDDYGGHFRRYTVPELKRDLAAAGLQPLYGTYFFAAFVPAVFAFRTVPGLLGRRRGDDTDRSAGEHALPDNMLGRGLERSLSWERDTIGKGHTVPFGTSCLVAARKI